MVPYFTVTYKLFQINLDGTLAPFDPTRGIYTANLVSKTATQAIERLKRNFHMLVVEVVSVSSRQEMTVEEYLNG